jgi:tRNA-binding protein
MITYEDFDKVDIRIGAIIQVNDFPQARKPAYQILIDFGVELGIKRSSAQVTHLYKKEELIGKQVLCVVNLPAKKIGPFVSQVLILGVPDQNEHVVLLRPEQTVVNGVRLF